MTLPAPGSIVTCYVPDRNIEAGKQYTVSAVYRRDLKLPVMIYLEGFEDVMFAPFRFVKPEKPPTWTRPNTSDLDPSAAETAAFEAARERAMKATKQKDLPK